MTTAVGNLKVTSNQLARYAKLIYDVAGIRISEQKKTLLANRLRRRLRGTGIRDFDAYYHHLRKLSATDPEWDAFLQEITTHETYLFRDKSHWEWFRATYLPELTSSARLGKRAKSLRIWSAACSTGDEAYTIASCIAAGLPNYSQWNIKIVGTDIGVGAVEQAKQATFGERAMKLVPDDMKRRYFTKAADAERWTAKPMLQSLTTFKQHNLLEPLRERAFDLVILKNVLIYFDRESKATAIDNLTKSLVKGGLLLAGAAEGVSDLMTNYERLHPWLYRKS